MTDDGFLSACSLAPAGPTRWLEDPEPLLELRGAAPASIVFGGGCFWGVQLVYQHVPGVLAAVCGYAGGSAASANYEQVCEGDSGHAEVVRVDYDPAVVRLGRLLNIFFSLVHDPTQYHRQGPDVGSQYRSVIYYSDDAQRALIAAYVAQLAAGGLFAAPIVTEVAPLPVFYPAETCHQNYALQHPGQPYIAYHDLPKLAALLQRFPEYLPAVE